MIFVSPATACSPRTITKPSPVITALAALSMWTPQGVEAGLLKGIKKEMKNLLEEVEEEAFEASGEEEAEESREEGVTVMQVFNGSASNLHCSIQGTYLGSVKWWSEDQTKPLRDSQAIGEYLTIGKVTEDMRITCEVSKANLSWQQRFLLEVINHIDDLKETKLNMPSLLEGYMCQDDRTTPILTMSNSGVSECNQENFENYQPQAPQLLVLLHRNRVLPVPINRCHAHLSSTVALCENGRTNSHRPVYNGPVHINATTCQQMHENGAGTIIIGEEEREFSGLSTEAPFHAQILLGGSTEDNTTKMGCVKMTGQLWLGYGYEGPVHRMFPFQEPWFSTGDLVITLDVEQGFVDYEQEFVSIPRIGKRLPFGEKDQEGKRIVKHQNIEHGIIYYDVEQETAQGYAIASDPLMSTIYKDGSTVQGHPDIITMNTTGTDGETGKSIALQLGTKFRLYNVTNCYNTHLHSIKVCHSFWPPKNMKRDTEVLKTLGSQYHLFMQLSISKSVSKILQEVCNTRKHLLEITFANFQLFGAASFELNRGVLAMSRGEESSLFQCALLGVTPILAPQGRCFDQLPVIAQTPEGPEKFYLSPRSRILVKNPSPVKCSEHFPVKFRIDERLSICQSNPKRGIHTCPSTSPINPAEGLMEGKYETLHEQESKTGKVTLVSDIIQIISDFVTMTNYRASVDASVVNNKRVCEGQLFCTQAFMTNMALRRESSRQSLSLYEWLTNSPLYEFLDLLALIWCSYVILSGTLSYQD